MRQFSSNTFVCFIDISGFTNKLQSSLVSAGEMLDTFYSAGYNSLKENDSLNGIFISDCGIIYPDKGIISERLEILLGVIKNINRKMLAANYLTTASIAFGYLEYRKKFVFDRIKKNAILGSGYLNAFLDNEHSEPKIRPGEVRLTKALHDLPRAEEPFTKIQFENGQNRFLIETQTHYYYNWLCDDINRKGNTIPAYKNFEADKTGERFDKLKLALTRLL